VGRPRACRGTKKTGLQPGLRLRPSGHSAPPLGERPHMHVVRTVAALRTDRQPLSEGPVLRALEAPVSRLARRLPAVPRASARVRSAACCRGAFGRWRCRWTTPLPALVVGDRRAVGIGRRASRYQTRPAAWSCAPCWRALDALADARRPETIASRRGPTRSSGTCFGSATRRGRRATRRRSRSWWRGWARLVPQSTALALDHLDGAGLARRTWLRIVLRPGPIGGGFGEADVVRRDGGM
jgi:hypothetical protein